VQEHVERVFHGAGGNCAMITLATRSGLFDMPGQYNDGRRNGKKQAVRQGVKAWAGLEPASPEGIFH